VNLIPSDVYFSISEIAAAEGVSENVVANDLNELVQDIKKAGLFKPEMVQGRSINGDLLMNYHAGKSPVTRQKLINLAKSKSANSIVNPQLAAIVTLATQLDSTMQRQQELEARQDKLEASQRSITQDNGMVSIIGWCNNNGIRNIDNNTAKSMGVQAAAYCRSNGIEFSKTNNQVFGTVNIYPDYVLDQLFGE